MRVDKSSWKKKRLADFFNLQMGKTPPRGELSLWENGNVTWVSISDMKNKRFISESKEQLPMSTINTYNIPIIPVGTVIMSFKLTIGKTCIVAKPLTTNEAIMAFYPKEDVEVNSSFLSYALSALKWKGNRAVKGVTINKKTISQKEFSLPPIAEQESIAAELDVLQDVIYSYREQIADLEALAQSIFLDTFGDPITNPKGWDSGTLNKLCEITSSKRIYQSELSDCGVPFYRISDFPNLILYGKSNTDIFIDKEKYQSLKANDLVPKDGDLLVTSRGTLGLCYMVKEDDCFYFQDGMITWLKNLNDMILPSFLGFIFSASLLNAQIENMKNGSTVSYLSISMFKKFKIVLPPIELQQQFATQVEAFEKQKDLLRQQLADAEMLMAERMQYYFS